MLGGTVYLADTLMTSGTVVLHHISNGAQGELDSLRLAEDGAFTFSLPNAPDPARGDIFFASVQHHGVLYFGPAITRAMDLDSIYEIHAYDTLVASGDVEVAMAGRSVFFEVETPELWRVTDLFSVRNDTDRTIVAPEGGETWRYPLPDVAENVTAGDGEASFDVASYEDGDLVVRAALPPGERLFIARYTVSSPYLSLPTPGVSEILDILVQEPVPPLEIPGLEVTEQVSLEAGATFRRYSAESYAADAVTLAEGEERGPPPVEWFAVILALILTVVGLFVVRGRAGLPAPAGTAGRASRQDLMMQIAVLDEEFEALSSPSASRRKAYRRRREELLEQLRGDG